MEVPLFNYTKMSDKIFNNNKKPHHKQIIYSFQLHLMVDKNYMLKNRLVFLEFEQQPNNKSKYIHHL